MQERSQLHYLFNLLLFDNFGVYVVFGSKPMAVMPLFDEVKADEYFAKEWETFSEEEKNTYEKEREELRAKGKLIEKLPHNPYECWETLQRIRKQLSFKKYIFSIWPVEDKPYLYSLNIADIQKTALVIAENYDLFRNIVEEDFHPLEMVFEMDNIDSSFWKKVFKNHLAQGILFGFGKKNSLFFTWNYYKGNNSKVKDYIRNIKWGKSTKENIPHDEGNSSNFSIPRFNCLEKDQFVKKYKKERKKILKIYKEKNMVDVTLEQLAE